MFERRPKARRPEDLLSGPGKLAPAFDITRADNWVDLFAGLRKSPPEARIGPSDLPPLGLEPGQAVEDILTTTRVGIAHGKAHDYPWRFVDAQRIRWASKPWPKEP
jgi:3-methyladenine DNA glycosylase Mpg